MCPAEERKAPDHTVKLGRAAQIWTNTLLLINCEWRFCYHFDFFSLKMIQSHIQMYCLAIIWESLSADDCFASNRAHQTAKVRITDQNRNQDSDVPRPLSCFEIIFWCPVGHNVRILLTRQLANLVVLSCGGEIFGKTDFLLWRLTWMPQQLRATNQKVRENVGTVAELTSYDTKSWRTKVNIGLVVDLIFRFLCSAMSLIYQKHLSTCCLNALSAQMQNIVHVAPNILMWTCWGQKIAKTVWGAHECSVIRKALLIDYESSIR